ncbi:hypothetical protein BDM02DRAFT_3163801, partial [Thelephora ganbajun]
CVVILTKINAKIKNQESGAGIPDYTRKSPIPGSLFKATWDQTGKETETKPSRVCVIASRLGLVIRSVRRFNVDAPLPLVSVTEEYPVSSSRSRTAPLHFHPATRLPHIAWTHPLGLIHIVPYPAWHSSRSLPARHRDFEVDITYFCASFSTIRHLYIPPSLKFLTLAYISTCQNSRDVIQSAPRFFIPFQGVVSEGLEET